MLDKIIQKTVRNLCDETSTISIKNTMSNSFVAYLQENRVFIEMGTGDIQNIPRFPRKIAFIK